MSTQSKKTKATQVRETRTDYKTDVANWLVIVHKSRYGYDVYCPALPGCNTQGNTLKEVLENARIAIEEYLQASAEIKKKIKKGGYLVETRVTF